MIPRINCCIEGCSRTMGHETAIKRFGLIPSEWICAWHWKRLTRAERRVWGRFKRQARRFGQLASTEVAERVWNALKRRAA